MRVLRAIVSELRAFAGLPVAWALALGAASVLAAGHWERYMGFRPKNALNCLFYRTQWLNIDRFGRGRSPLIGLGDFPLAGWVHVTRLSSHLYANAGAVVMLAGTLAWVVAHAVWAGTVGVAWTAVIVATLLLSTTAYAFAFFRMNYNVLGWMMLPLVLWAAMTGHWALAALALFAASFLSVTAVASSVPLLAAIAAREGSWMALAVVLPAALKLASHLLPVIGQGAQSTVAGIGRSIGAVRRGVRYRRHSMRFGRRAVYLAVLYFAATVALWAVDGRIPVVAAAALALFVVNQRFVRFADDQSVMILFVSAFAAEVASGSPGWFPWIVLLVVVNPPPRLLGITASDGRIAVFGPFDHTRIVEAADALFAHVPSGKRVLFAFDDPDGHYERLFDGYRVVLEPVQYAAIRRGIHLFPDWYAVSETNHPGAPTIWGRSLAEVLANRVRWNADFVLVYVTPDAPLAKEWFDAFDVVGTLDWSDHRSELEAAPPWSRTKPWPTFHLLAPRR